MARPLSFNPAEALDRAMVLFWEMGYAHVSIQDLTEALGINRPSLYAAFGDKETLFVKALQRYRDLFIEPVLAAARAAAPGRAAIAAMFEEVKRTYANAFMPQGCLFTNTLVEWSGEGPVWELLNAWRAEFHRAIRGALAEAQRRKEIAPDKDIGTLAVFVMTTLKAIALEARTARNPELVRKLADEAKAAL